MVVQCGCQSPLFDHSSPRVADMNTAAAVGSFVVVVVVVVASWGEVGLDALERWLFPHEKRKRRRRYRWNGHLHCGMVG